MKIFVDVVVAVVEFAAAFVTEAANSFVVAFDMNRPFFFILIKSVSY